LADYNFSTKLPILLAFRITEIENLNVLKANPILVSQFPGLIQAGFPSPAADYFEETIDLEQF